MTKLTVVFFASLKESLAIGQYQVVGDFPMSVKALKQMLASELENGDALLAAGIQSSVDYEFARDTDMISNTAKEVAFFPPVTGG
ncbi:MAG: MoaD/ThiS family protein [Marinomonas sp.]|jgi:molybdopterin synthase sulfur carrier subunit|uniref:MoaD/ThiS family protein n=1 Tax=Marinomonas TaxID=28253 RepID=UPI001054CB09|nr:MoaD/ThiS family protein [Marinomonas sp. KMM3893]